MVLCLVAAGGEENLGGERGVCEGLRQGIEELDDKEKVLAGYV